MPDDPRARSVVVRGALDIQTAPDLERTLDEAIDDGALLIIVNLEEVSFLDSSGLRVVLSAADRVAGRGGQLFVSGMSSAAQRVLEVAGVIERLRQDTADGA